MSLNNVIRSASRVVPLAIRASAGTRWSFHRHYSSALCATVDGRVREFSRSMLQRSFPSFLHQYSTERSETSSGEELLETSSDKELLEVMEEEIYCASTYQSTEADVEIPEDLPFKIEDSDEMETIKLTREYKGETISVEVHMSNLVTGDADGSTGKNHSAVPLVVTTSKKGGPYLQFDCSAYPDEVAIWSLSVKDPEISDQQMAYRGRDFGDLDENLQKAFHRYLDIRGINTSTTDFLHAYMIEKDYRIYLKWLKKVDKFLYA